MGVGVCNGECDSKIVTEVDGFKENEGVHDELQLAACHLSCCLVPLGREQGDFPMEANSLHTVAVRKQICNAADSGDLCAVSPQTPKPGKISEAVENQCCGRLHDQRDSADDAESLSDHEIFQTICENLLELIVAEQTEGDHAEIDGRECDADVCTTPPEALSFVTADSCPAAPSKPHRIQKTIDLGHCRRKLAF